MIRNTAMRFGICVSLWSKEEWGGESDVAPAPKKKAPAKKAPEPAPVADSEKVDEETLSRFIAACAGAKLEPQKVAKHAKVADINNVTLADLDRLRESFKELISQ